jgi:hypothetical protein
MLSVGLSPPEPAFKFVLVFIALLLSDIFKASRLPIADTPSSNVADRLESIALKGDGGLRTTPLEPAGPLPRSASDYLIG